MRKVRFFNNKITLMIVIPTIGAVLGCRANYEEFQVPPNGTLTMHLIDPFPYVEIRDESGKLLQKIEILPEENHIEIAPGD